MKHHILIMLLLIMINTVKLFAVNQMDLIMTLSGDVNGDGYADFLSFIDKVWLGSSPFSNTHNFLLDYGSFLNFEYGMWPAIVHGRGTGLDTSSCPLRCRLSTEPTPFAYTAPDSITISLRMNYVSHTQFIPDAYSLAAGEAELTLSLGGEMSLAGW